MAERKVPLPAPAKIIDRIQELLHPLLDEFGEPAAFIVAIPWTVGMNDFPFGTVVARDNLKAEECLDAIDQTRKMLGFLTNHFQEWVERGRELIREAKEKLRASQSSPQEDPQAGGPAASGESGGSPPAAGHR